MRTSVVALAFGMGLGMSSVATAAWTPTAQQCVQLQEDCLEGDDANACRAWTTHFKYCMRVM